MSMSKIDGCLRVFTLYYWYLTSCFMWIGALYSSNLLLSHSSILTSRAHNQYTDIYLLLNNKHINI